MSCVPPKVVENWQWQRRGWGHPIDAFVMPRYQRRKIWHNLHVLPQKEGNIYYAAGVQQYLFYWQRRRNKLWNCWKEIAWQFWQRVVRVVQFSCNFLHYNSYFIDSCAKNCYFGNSWQHVALYNYEYPINQQNSNFVYPLTVESYYLCQQKMLRAGRRRRARPHKIFLCLISINSRVGIVLSVASSI